VIGLGNPIIFLSSFYYIGKYCFYNQYVKNASTTTSWQASIAILPAMPAELAEPALPASCIFMIKIFGYENIAIIFYNA